MILPNTTLANRIAGALGVVTDYFDDVELGLCLRVNALSRHVRIRQFFTAISRLGDYPAYVILGLVCVAQLGDAAPLFAVQTLVTAGIGIAVYKILKRRLVRERPFITHGDIICGAAPLDRYSFPSGHTLHAVSFAILYSSHVPGMVWVMVPFALLIAASRVVLGLHYPSDVVVGGAIGAAIALTSISAFA